MAKHRRERQNTRQGGQKTEVIRLLTQYLDMRLHVHAANFLGEVLLGGHSPATVVGSLLASGAAGLDRAEMVTLVAERYGALAAVPGRPAGAIHILGLLGAGEEGLERGQARHEHGFRGLTSAATALAIPMDGCESLTNRRFNGRPQRQPGEFGMLFGAIEDADPYDGEDHHDEPQGEEAAEGKLLTDVHPDPPDEVDGEPNDWVVVESAREDPRAGNGTR